MGHTGASHQSTSCALSRSACQVWQNGEEDLAQRRSVTCTDSMQVQTHATAHHGEIMLMFSYPALTQ